MSTSRKNAARMNELISTWAADWWHLDGADTCSLFSMWMTRLLAEENTDSHAAEDRATQSPRPAPAMRKSQQGSTWRVGVDQEPARHADGQVEARTNSDCDNLLSITSHLHPAAPPGGSSEEEWNELYDNLPVEVQVLMDRIVDKYGGSSRATSEPRNMSASRIDLPNVWKRLQLNQMGSYTHPEHIAGEYERSWRFLTGTGIYPLTSIGFNHSCTPNLLRISVGPVIIFRTSRPVAPGEPLSISYVGTDLLREPLDLRLGDDDEDGGGLGDRDFTCVCALCTTEREAAPLPLGGSRAAVKLPVHVKGCLQLMSAKERIAAIRGLLAGGRALRDALQRVCQGVDDEDDEAGPGELDQGTGRSLSSLGLKSLAEAAAGGVEGAAGEGARNVASAPSAEPSAVGTGSGGVQRLLNKDALEVSVQLSMTLLECGRPHEALEAIRQASARARAEWLPRDTRDELQSSFALYALVAAVAVATDPCGGDGGHQGTRPCTPREAADQVVLETEAVFGWKAAAAVARHGAPSALKREIDAVCAKVPHGEEVAAAAWRTLAAAAASHWGGGEGSVASPGRVEVVTSSGEGEGAAACGASAPPAAWQQDQVRGHLASGSLGGLQADAVISSGADFSKEWEEEMLEYGYSQGDLAKMRAGEWGEGDVDV